MKAVAARISVLYAVLAGIWILLSDRLLVWLAPEPGRLTSLQTYKGWAFVIVTTVLLYSVLRQCLGALCESEEARLTAESRKRELAERLQHYLAVSPTVTYALKVEGTTIRTVWVSDNIPRVLGYTVEEAVGPNWWADHLHPEDRNRALANQARLWEEGLLVHEYRFHALELKDRRSQQAGRRDDRRYRPKDERQGRRSGTRPATDIPHCHHERWDGTRYPRGLKGEEILLPARVFAVAGILS